MQDEKNERREFSSSKQQQNSLSNETTILFFLFLGVVTAVLVVCVRYGSYVDDGRVNEPICAYAGDMQVATN